MSGDKSEPACSKCKEQRPLAKRGKAKDSWCKRCRAEATAAYFKTPKGKYVAHKNGARIRGIPWEFTFETWLALWAPYWSKRGTTGSLLQMGRKQDKGPYSPANVVIISQAQNVSDAWRNGKHQKSYRRGK